MKRKERIRAQGSVYVNSERFVVLVKTHIWYYHFKVQKQNSLIH